MAEIKTTLTTSPEPDRVTGRDLLDLGFPQGPQLGAALAHVRASGLRGAELAAYVAAHKPAPRVGLQTAPPMIVNLDADPGVPAEVENRAKVVETMAELMRTPTVRAGVVMPDACPAGPLGTIPVGGVAVTEGAIHPGMHSADICCSLMLTDMGDADPAAVMDAMAQITHFGPGGRRNGQRFTLSSKLYDGFRDNAFLRDPKILRAAQEHLGTQGDGNHFAYVGRRASTGTTCLVTHHGSRGPGAGLYKLGMRAAEGFRRQLSEGVLKQNAWIPANTPEGASYWDALQLIRRWTKANHNCLHQAVVEAVGATNQDRFWNEHNFVFRDGDMFFHAKGATPIEAGFLPDSGGVQIVPLNMAEPILLVSGTTTQTNLGFAPHGAGRNMSRTAHKRAQAHRSEAEIFAAETAGLDVRFWTGEMDISELPSAYKPAATVRAQINRYDLAQIVDQIEPFGAIMAGDWERNASWKIKARAKHAVRAQSSGSQSGDQPDGR